MKTAAESVTRPSKASLSRAITIWQFSPFLPVPVCASIHCNARARPSRLLEREPAGQHGNLQPWPALDAPEQAGGLALP
jgi:hypothetical protein